MRSRAASRRAAAAYPGRRARARVAAARRRAKRLDHLAPLFTQLTKTAVQADLLLREEATINRGGGGRVRVPRWGGDCATG